jgi:hypothetical protein
VLCVRRNEIPADDAVRAGQWVADSLVDEEERIPWPKTLSTQLCSIIICSVNSGLPRATTVAGSFCFGLVEGVFVSRISRCIARSAVFSL